jgi:hypothetical protein
LITATVTRTFPNCAELRRSTKSPKLSKRIKVMKSIQTVIGVLLASFAFSTTTFAQSPEPTCNSVALERKLAGAAKTSFLKKCERQATEKCEAAAAERKLAGAAKNSNVKKCVKDAVGE